MRILQLSKKLPYPLHDGEAIAVHALMTALQELGCDITLLVMSTPKHPADTAILPKNYTHYTAIHTVEVDTDVRFFTAFYNLFTKESYNINRFYDAAFAQKLTALLRQNDYDIIQLETLFLAPYTDLIRANSKAKIVLRAHNVEHEIWQRMAANEHFLPKKWYLKLLAHRLKTFEIEKINAYDLVVSITDRDRQCYLDLGSTIKNIVAPVGVKLNSANNLISPIPNPQSPNPNPLKIGFIGSLDWLPNIEGMEWFLNEIWCELVRQNPHISLHIAGRNMPKYWQQHSYPNVKMLGEVSDAHTFINAHDIMLIPLLSGGGMRIKAIEAMWLGKPVITTTVGIEGIKGTHGTHFYVADTQADFIKAIDFFEKNPAHLPLMGEQAHQFITTHFDQNAIAARVLAAYNEC